MSKEHELKCWISSYEAIERGEKPWEFRRNDRDFQVGDVLKLDKWDPGMRYGGGYVWPHVTLRRRVTYILHGGQFGIPVGFCIMTLATEAT